MSREVTASHREPVFVLYGFWDLKPQAVTELLAALGNSMLCPSGWMRSLLCSTWWVRSVTLVWDPRLLTEEEKRYRKPHSVLYSLCPFSQPLALLMLLNLELPSQALEMNRSSFFITYLNNVLKVAQLLQGWIPQYELIRENFSLYRRKREFGWAQALNFPRNQWKNEGSAWRCKKLGKTWGRLL